jgi:hypothetical protein
MARLSGLGEEGSETAAPHLVPEHEGVNAEVNVAGEKPHGAECVLYNTGRQAGKTEDRPGASPLHLASNDAEKGATPKKGPGP